jgi:hypothetical protein
MTAIRPSDTRVGDPSLVLDFAGEIFQVVPDETFIIGRQGQLALDDNPYLHRRFIVLSFRDGLWWVANTGTRLPVIVSDSHGLMRSVLAPGASLPIVFPEVLLTFTAGPTAYEIQIECAVDGFFTPAHRVDDVAGDTTVGPSRFTPSQRLLMLALAEPVLRRAGTGASEIPASADAARRLGWNLTRFNRKLDNVCDKLTTAGVKGLRGDSEDQATNRRAALVEYAVSTLLVRIDDMPLLDAERAANRRDVSVSAPTGTVRVPSGRLS